MRNGDDLLIELAQTATDEVRVLIGELENVLSAEYPPEQRHGLSLDAIFQPDVRFFVARKDGVAVGCGGVALFGDFAEVKRMYVRDTACGQGVADAILVRIEQEALRAGLSVLRLETGNPPVRRDAPLCARGISCMRGVRRLCLDGTTIAREQRVPREAGSRAIP
jgi:putative acetyltransferase